MIRKSIFEEGMEGLKRSWRKVSSEVSQRKAKVTDKTRTRCFIERTMDGGFETGDNPKRFRERGEKAVSRPRARTSETEFGQFQVPINFVPTSLVGSVQPSSKHKSDSIYSATRVALSCTH